MLHNNSFSNFVCIRMSDAELSFYSPQNHKLLKCKSHTLSCCMLGLLNQQRIAQIMPRCHEEDSNASDCDQECAESGEEGGDSDNASNADKADVGRVPEDAQNLQAARCEEDSGSLYDDNHAAQTSPLACVEIEHYVVGPGCVRRLVMHMAVDPVVTGDATERFEVIECVSSDAEPGADEYKHTRFADVQKAIDHLRSEGKHVDGRNTTRTKKPNITSNTFPTSCSKTGKRKQDQLNSNSTQKVVRAVKSR